MIRWLAFVAVGCVALSSIAEDTNTAQPVQADRAENGRAAYARVCAHCHDTGLGGAPVTGHAADWRNRSHLWQAVLVEHARRGYMNMPAQGGDAALSDADVQAAAEYMLSITHPDAKHD